MKKKLLAIIATAAMVVTMIPSMVLADEANVAQIGSQGYPTLQAALDAANDGETVKLLKDISMDSTDVVETEDADKYDVLIYVSKGKAIKLNMNGKTITVNHPSTDAAERIYSVVCIEDGASLEVFGNGLIDVTCDATSPRVAYTFWKRGTTGELIINDGTYHMNDSEDSVVYTNGDEIVTVNGGTFTIDSIGTGENGSPWIFNAKGQNEKNIVVTGGTFNADVNHQYWIFEVQAPKEKALKNNGDGTWTIVDAVAYVDEWNKSGKWYDKEVGYATLKEAVDAVNTRGKAEQAGKDSEKITLLKDAKISDTLHFMKDTNLELNGKKIIWEGKDDKPVVSFDNGVVISEFDPSKEGYTFKGWYTDAKYENAWNWDFESLNLQTRATANVTSLYAKWTEAPVPEKSPDTGDNSLPYTLAVAGMVLAAMAAVVATRRRTN